MSKRNIVKVVTLLMVLSLFMPTVLAEEKAAYKNLVLGKAYKVSTSPRDIWEDTDSKELTDGIYGKKDLSDSAWQGHHRSDQAGGKRTIEFDLEEPKSVKRITANYLHDTGQGIRYPLNTVMSVSGDGENWIELDKALTKTDLIEESLATQKFYWDGKSDGVPGQEHDVDAVYVQYVKVEFEIDAPWAFIDEIEVLGVDGKIENALDLTEDGEGITVPNVDLAPIIDLSEYQHLSEGLDYTISVPPSSAYPDKDGNTLTNGKSGGKNFDSKEWQGHNKADGQSREIIIDLEESKSIGYISANFLNAPDEGVGFPSNVTVEVSTDGEDDSWATLGDVLSKKAEGYDTYATQEFFWDGRVDDFNKEDPETTMAYARYVKISFDLGESNWAFIDQIKVFGLHEETDNSEVIPPNTGKPEIELPEGADYMRSGDVTGGANNIALIYNHVNTTWNQDDLVPYLSYINKRNKIKDWFFDSVLYLGLRTPEGNTFDTNTQNPSNLADWEWYLNRTFKEDGDMSELNKAAKKVAKELDEPDKKTKVFLMIPYPSIHQSNFGDIQDDTLNFNPNDVGDQTSFENRKKALEWYVDSAINRWDEGNYDQLDLVGLYWVAENVESSIPYEEDVVRYASELVHEKGLKHFWIPYFRAAGFEKWKELGFDMAVLQPNFYFNKYASEDRIEETSLLARKLGIGVEIEFDEAVRLDNEEGAEKREKFKEYLDSAPKYGYDGDVLRAYYQGGKTLVALATSGSEMERTIYDDTYKFVRNTEVLPEDSDEEPGEPTDETLAGLSEQLEAYIDAGDVHTPLVNQLRNSLKQASHHLNKGSQQKAVFFVEKFLKHLNNKSMQKHVSEEAKTELQSKAQALLNNW